MTEEQRNALFRYEEVKIAIRELEDELETLKPGLLEIIPEDKELKAKYGSFVLKARPKWEYSPRTQATEKDLKQTKKLEKADGTAKEIFGEPFIKYSSKK